MVGEESATSNSAKHMKDRKSGTIQGQSISKTHSPDQERHFAKPWHGQVLFEQVIFSVHLPSYSDLI